MYPYPPMKNNFRCVQWRVDVLHTCTVETVFRKYMQRVIQPLFEAFSQKDSMRRSFLSPNDWFALLDALDVLPYQDNPMGAWDRVWLWQISAMSHADELMTSNHLQLVFVEYLEALARLVGLLRSRQRVDDASPDECERWDYGLEAASASSIFCADKDGVMDKDSFATHLDTFLSSEIVMRAASGPRL